MASYTPMDAVDPAENGGASSASRARKLESRTLEVPVSLPVTTSAEMLGSPQHEKEMTVVSLEEDAYGYFMLTLIRVCDVFDEHEHSPGGHSPVMPSQNHRLCGLHSEMRCLWLGHAVMLYITNIIIQFAIAGHLLVDVIGPMETGFEQAQYDLSAATNVLRIALQEAAPLEMNHDNREILDRCKAQCPIPPLMYFIMVFVWLATMSRELRQCGTMSIRLFNVKGRADNQVHMIEHVDGQGAGHKSHIKFLDAPIRLVLFVFIYGVKVCIALLVGYAGVKFLMLTTEEAQLIMKSIVLQFVINIDELLYTVFTTSAAKEKLKKTKMEYYTKHASADVWDNWLGGVVTYFMCVIVLLLCAFVLFGDLMLFRETCRSYFAVWPLEDQGFSVHNRLLQGELVVV